MRTQAVVLASTPALSGSDTSVTQSGVWNIKGVEPINRHSEVISASLLIASVAATAGVLTLTPTAAATTEYAFTLNQYITTQKEWVTQRISYVSKDSGDTATTISTALKNLITTYLAKGFDVTPTGTTTTIVTATTTNPYISITGLTSSLALANTTPPVWARGTAAWVAANFAGVTVETGATYSVSTIVTAPLSKADAAGNLNMGNLTVFLIVNEANSGFATFKTAYELVVHPVVVADTNVTVRIG